MAENVKETPKNLEAAAPDLYEAAAYLVAHADHDPESGLDGQTYDEAWRMLVLAVLKAEQE